MQVNDLFVLRMELMAECLVKQPAFLEHKSPWSSSLSTIYTATAFCAFKILTPVRRAVAIQSSSGLSRFQH